MHDEQALAELHNAAVEIQAMRDEQRWVNPVVDAAILRALTHVESARKLIEYANGHYTLGKRTPTA